MIASSRTYAIGMVHFVIGGGWKIIVILIALYFLIFLGGAALFYYICFLSKDPPDPREILTAARVIVALLLALQGVALVAIGGFSVSNAIRRDISSRMLESHRLMPIASTNAIWGYLFGPTTAVTVFVALNLVLTLIFGTLNGVSPGRILVNQAVIYAFGVFVWSLVALSTFIYRHIFIVGLAVMFLGGCMFIYAPTLCPGFGLMMTPFVGESIFNLGFTGGRPFDLGYVLGIAGQAALFIIFFFGACRLYRGTYRLVFNEFQSLALLGVWSALSAAGIHFSNQIGFQGIFGRGEYEQSLGMIQVTASVVSCLLLALIPLWVLIHEPRQQNTPTPVRLGAIAAIALLAALPACGAVWLQSFSYQNLGLTLIVATAQIVIIYATLQLARNLHFLLASLITGGVLLALWVGPLVLELIRLLILERQGRYNDSGLSVLGTLSPIAFLVALWDGTTKVSLTPGLLTQLASAALLGLVATWVTLRRKTPSARPAPVLLAPPIQPTETGPSRS